MDICLVTAPTISDFGDPDVTLDAHKPRGPHLGILTLAAAVRQRGHHPSVVDLDRIALDTLLAGGADISPNDLLDAFLAALAPVDVPFFGFSTICGSYPLTLRLTKLVAAQHPDAMIVLGGPQASVVDLATINRFEWIDAIVRGEADRSLPDLLDRLDLRGEHLASTALAPQELAGVTVRRFQAAVRGPGAPLVADLDDLPLPAFDLDPNVGRRGSVHLELGRGCPYGCTFCSTNDFFRRRFRLKSADTMVRQMRQLHTDYGVRAFSLVHDMFTVRRDDVVDFCRAVLATGETYEWSCSARTDRVDHELLTLMGEAGCRGIFFGVETASPSLQKQIKKRLDLTQSWKAIESATGNGMKTAVALIAGFPEETRDDLRETAHFYVRSTRFDTAEPQMSLLAPLAGTPIEHEYRDRLVFDHIYSDMSHQGWRENPEDLELILRHPDIFPNFYSLPSLLPRAYVRHVHDFLMGVTLWFRWLPLALLDSTADLLGVFDSWLADREAKGDTWGEGAGADPVQPTLRYYCSNLFRNDFLSFVAERLDDGSLPATDLLRHTLEYENALAELSPASAPVREPTPVIRATAQCRLLIAANVTIRAFDFDVAVLLQALRRGVAYAGSASARRCVCAFEVFADRPVNVLQLSDSAADLLALCDGATVADVAQQYTGAMSVAGRARRSGSRTRAEKAAIAGLAQLYRDGILDVTDGRHQPIPEPAPAAGS
jgi:radical SAM superfamily enzyme YgiQ (UPF0313 family)